MGFMDDLDEKAKAIMSDPNKRAQVEQLAKEKGISMDQALKEHMAKPENN